MKDPITGAQIFGPGDNNDRRGFSFESILQFSRRLEKHPFRDSGCIDRLKHEYNTHGNLVVGFDFDNTIFDIHNNGGDYSEVIKLLQECKTLGFTLCLYTAELQEEWLKWKMDYCKHFGIEPDYVNESPLLSGTKKPFFNILLDDRAGLESAYNILRQVVDYANSKSSKSGEK